MLHQCQENRQAEGVVHDRSALMLKPGIGRRNKPISQQKPLSGHQPGPAPGSGLQGT